MTDSRDPEQIQSEIEQTREELGETIEARLAGELAKDLTGHPIPDIEAALMAAS